MKEIKSAPLFGPAGNGESFYNEGYKNTLEICRWLQDKGLSAYEYQATRGIKGSPEFFKALGEKAQKADIALSIHAPYYISLGNPDTSIGHKSIGYIMDSLRAAKLMGASRVVIHLGGICKQERKTALHNAKNMLASVLEKALIDNLLDNIYLCPETMGKPGQLGNLEEVLEICKMHNALRPTLDFAHLHAVSQGGMRDKAAFIRVFERVVAVLGYDVIENCHIHFSPIEYGKAGELRHRCCKEKIFGPDFRLFSEAIIDLGLSPTIICESAGTQPEDAALFKDIYHQIAGNVNRASII